ncbi:MAG: shikimate kinase [Bacteroidota bacterium]|nr:shikimate kinase [Bacteroidota bacterium]
MHLSLIGFMGSGKSTVGAYLADHLGRPFVDTDTEVERMLGMSVKDIFDKLGEPAFREAEQDALSEALRAQAPIVLATGGGTPCAEGAMEWMRRRSLVVALQPPLEVLLERLSAGQSQRPLLRDKQGHELKHAVERMLLTRAACYASAHVVWRQVLDNQEAMDEALASIRWRIDD